MGVNRRVMFIYKFLQVACKLANRTMWDIERMGEIIMQLWSLETATEFIKRQRTTAGSTVYTTLTLVLKEQNYNILI